MKRFHKVAVTIVIGLLTGPIIIYAFYVLTLGPFPTSKVAALAAETETLQTAMYAMMMDKDITTVTPNDDTTGGLGAKSWSNLPVGPDSASLDGYLIKATTHFYYCWDSNGNVYAQNKKDGVRATPEDAKKQRPCKKTPWNPS